MIRDERILDPDFDFLPDPGFKKAPDPGSGYATLTKSDILHRETSIKLG
jgi:hypothetical protein